MRDNIWTDRDYLIRLVRDGEAMQRDLREMRARHKRIEAMLEGLCMGASSPAAAQQPSRGDGSARAAGRGGMMPCERDNLELRRMIVDLLQSADSSWEYWDTEGHDWAATVRRASDLIRSYNNGTRKRKRSWRFWQ